MSIYDQYIQELMYNGFEKFAMKAEDLYSVYRQKGAQGVADIINKKKGQINGHAVSKLLTAFNIPEAEVQNIVSTIPAKLYKGLTVNSSGHRLPATVHQNSAVATHLPAAKSGPDAVNTPNGEVNVSPKPNQQTVVKNRPPVTPKKIRVKQKRAVKQLPQTRRVITEGTRVPQPLKNVPIEAQTPIVVKKPEMLVSAPPAPVIGSGAPATAHAPSSATTHVEPIIGSGNTGGSGYDYSPRKTTHSPKPSNRNKYLLAAGLAGLAGAGAYAYSRRKKDDRK